MSPAPAYPGREGLPPTEGRGEGPALDRMSAREIVACMNREDSRVAGAVAAVSEAVAAAIETVAAVFIGGGRLVYVGAGTSGRLAMLDAVECPPTFGAGPGQVVALIAGAARERRGRRGRPGAGDGRSQGA